MSQTFSILGATGNTGRRTAELLRKEGATVRVLGRDATRLASLAALGCQTHTVQADDAASLEAAIRGSDAIYALLPPNPEASDFSAHQDRLGQALTTAVERSGVKKVVFLSSLGADLAEGTGPIKGLYRQEKRFEGLSGVDFLFLRPTYFFENSFGTLGLIKHQGINGGAIRGDLAFPMIASADIATVAAQSLLAGNFRGTTVRELLGPRDLTLNEATKILGQKIGKPELPYVQFPYADFQGALQGMGFSADVARLYSEMAQAFNEGKVRSHQGRTALTTTPTTFESFADTLAGAYQAM